eukprot:270008-Amphidinium_carterae.1
MELNLDNMRIQLAMEGKCLHIGTSSALLYSKLSKTMFEVDVKEPEKPVVPRSFLSSMVACCVHRDGSA